MEKKQGRKAKIAGIILLFILGCANKVVYLGNEDAVLYHDYYEHCEKDRHETEELLDECLEFGEVLRREMEFHREGD